MQRLSLILGSSVLLIVLGLAEGAVALPVLSIGLVLMLARQVEQWWLRLIIIVLTSLVWGSAFAVSITVIIVLLLVAVWSDKLARAFMPTRMSLLIITVVCAVLIGFLRGMTPSVSGAIVLMGQVWLWWLLTRLAVGSKVPSLLFHLPPPTHATHH